MFKLLGIGNSFSNDAFDWVYQMVESLKIQDISVNNLGIAGCTLDMHLNNIENDLPAYDYRRFDKKISSSNFKISEAFKLDDWQYITLQQSSYDSGTNETYINLPKIVEYVKNMKPKNAKLCWHLTWAYKGTSTHPEFYRYNSNQMDMYNSIIDCCKKNVLNNDNFFKIIPSGTAVQNARTSSLGDNLTRDTIHLSFDFGRYIAGLCVVCTLLEIQPETIPFVPDGVDNYRRKIAIESVKNALKNPFNITKSTM